MPRQESGVVQHAQSGSDGSQSDDSQPPAPPRSGACHKCRSRKVKCGQELPGCLRCATSRVPCVYDSAPVRRGKDKSARKRRPSRHQARIDAMRSKFDQPVRSDSRSRGNVTFRSGYSVANQTISGELTLFNPPSLGYFRSSWWDHLLQVYSNNTQEAVLKISHDLSAFFKNAHFLFSFIHIPSFLNRIARPHTRERMQPSLILACLGLSSLMQSNAPGRAVQKDRAMTLLNWAQSAFEASVAAQWLDVPLAQAAMFLATFETSPYPRQSLTRIVESMSRIDILVSSLGLPQMDAGTPGASYLNSSWTGGALTDSLRAIPTTTTADFDSTREFPSDAIWPPLAHNRSVAVRLVPANDSAELAKAMPLESVCSCYESSLGANIIENGPVKLSIGFRGSPGWEVTWLEEDIMREEARRLVWAVVALLAGRSAHSSAALKIQPPFHTTSSSQFCVLFPGEALRIARGDYVTGKNTVWALSSRGQLLWHAAVQLHHANLPKDERAPIAANICLEVDRLTNALNQHRCDTEANLLFASRYYMQYARLGVTGYFRNFSPNPYSGRIPSQRSQAQEWVAHLQGFLHNMSKPEFKDDMARSIFWNPWMIWILIDQILRCLQLWELDNKLKQALDVAHHLRIALMNTIAVWSPAPFLEDYHDKLADRIKYAYTTISLKQLPTLDVIPPAPLPPTAFRLATSLSVAKR